MMKISENAQKIVGSQLIDAVVSEKQLTDNISFVCVDKGEMVTPRFNFGVVKNGEYKQTGVQKELILTLKDGIQREKIEDAIENGDAIKYSKDDLFEIAKELEYIIPVSEEAIADIVRKFCYHDDGEYYRKIKSILNSDEKASFKEWENSVGFEFREPLFKFHKGIKFKEYNCDGDWRVESALYVVMHSPRLLNCAIYLKESFLMESDWNHVWNYLVCYEHTESFIEVMHFSDWDKNDPDVLLEKYGIPDEIVEIEDKSSIRRNDASLRVGDDYKMAMQIRAGFDDWDGVAVVVPKSCKLSPMEIVSAGESVNYVERNFFVKNQLVRRTH